MNTGPETPEHPRLNLKPLGVARGATDGAVDGAWWPASRDLGLELPALLAAVASAAGAVAAVRYNVTVWRQPPRTIRVGGEPVRLTGGHGQAADTLTLTSPARSLTVLVVPPETPDERALAILAAAGHPENVDTVAALLPPHSARRSSAPDQLIPDRRRPPWPSAP